jgi:hypothetical protein
MADLLTTREYWQTHASPGGARRFSFSLLLCFSKDALTLKGRVHWADRADIVYEVRDATGFTPSGKKPWWQELPEAEKAAWADRAARRRGIR